MQEARWLPGLIPGAMRQRVRKILPGDFERLCTGLPVLIVNRSVFSTEACLKKVNLFFPVLCAHPDAHLDELIVVVGWHDRSCSRTPLLKSAPYAVPITRS